MISVPIAPPNAPDWARTFCQDTAEALRLLATPQGPSQLYAVTSTQIASIPASDYPNCAVAVTDKKSIAVSTLNAGLWAWTRADGTVI